MWTDSSPKRIYKWRHSLGQNPMTHRHLTNELRKRNPHKELKRNGQTGRKIRWIRSHYGCVQLDSKARRSTKELMPLNCRVGEDSWEPVGLQGDPTSQSLGKSTLNTHWKDCCWSWNSSILVIWWQHLTHWKSPWCWEIMRAEGEEGIRGWDGWMASPMQWTWTWTNFRGWWETGRPGMLQPMGSQGVRYGLNETF